MSKDKESQRRASKKHYEAHRPEMIARAKAHKAKSRLEVRAFIAGYLATHDCVDCGEPDPVVLEFDHREPELKKFNIGDAARVGYSLKSIAAEIEKCDVRCANCHRRRHRS